MIVNMSDNATEQQIDHIIQRIREAGFQPHAVLETYQMCSRPGHPFNRVVDISSQIDRKIDAIAQCRSQGGGNSIYATEFELLGELAGGGGGGASAESSLKDAVNLLSADNGGAILAAQNNVWPLYERVAKHRVGQMRKTLGCDQANFQRSHGNPAVWAIEMGVQSCAGLQFEHLDAGVERPDPRKGCVKVMDEGLRDLL